MQLATDLQRIVDRLVADGRYESEDAVIRAALEILARSEEDWSAIRDGLDDVDAGRVVEHADVVSEGRDRLNARRTL